MPSSQPIRITTASINFYPDHAGIAIYATDFPVFMAQQGHRVAMVSGFPYYPTWRKRSGDRRTLFRKDEYRGVQVYRGYIYVPTDVTTFRRILHEASFCAFAALNFLRAGRPDIIIVFTPPILLGLVALAFKMLWRCPLVVNIQDLPIEAATSLGMVKRGFLTRALLALEGVVYRRSDLVTTISEGMRATLVGKGVHAEKIAITPNWIDVAAARWNVAKGRFKSTHAMARDRFTVAYAGNLGIKQGVRTLLELAQAVPDRGAHFFIIGDGADKPALQQLAQKLGLTNVTFLPFLDHEAYKEMLEDIDVVFVAQRTGTGNIFFPSKLLGIMAAGKPMLVSADPESELSQVVATRRVGLVSRFGDVGALQENFSRLRDDAELRRELATNGYRYVLEYDRTRILHRVEEEMQRLVRKEVAAA